MVVAWRCILVQQHRLPPREGRREQRIPRRDGAWSRMGVSTGAAFADAETTWYGRWWPADSTATVTATATEAPQTIVNVAEAVDLLTEALRLLKEKLPEEAISKRYPHWFRKNGELSAAGIRHGFSLLDEGFSASDVAAQMGIWPRKAAALFRMWKRDQEKWSDTHE